MKNLTYIFLDTNIFIHFKNFEDINWKNELRLEGSYEIVLAPIIIDELDKHKYNQNQKISRRIKKLLPRIENLIIENKITLITNRPHLSTFDAHNLDKSEQDDSLLASIIEFKAKNKNVIYVTNDTGPRLKALTLEIKSFKISQNLIIDNEEDEVVKENKKLKNELNEIKNTRPIIEFNFKNGKDYFLRQKNKILPEKKQFVETVLSTEKSKNLFLKNEIFENDNSITSIHKMFSSLSDSQIKSYNSNLEKYFKSYKEYLDSLYDQQKYDNSILEINLVMDNVGSQPAEDVDIFIQFPKELKIINKNGVKQIAKSKPTLPEKPKPMMMDIGFLSTYYPNSHLRKASYPVNYTIQKENIVHFHTKTLKHNQMYEIDSIYILYENIDDAKAFQISYKIQVANLSKEINGFLNINFE